MKIKQAKSLGYCLGVRRAMDMALKNLGQRRGNVYSYGPLIHNPQALYLLAGKGLKIYKNGDQPPEKGSTVIIRAHGLPPEEVSRLSAWGCRIQDATCPRVVKVQRLVHRYSLQGYRIIIWGAADHPEVVGLMGYAAGRGLVANGVDAINRLPDYAKVALVAQTTQAVDEWPKIIAAVTARWPEALVFNTICEATVSRQAEVAKLAGEVEGLVVVGGRGSGNTRRLAELAAGKGAKTLVVEQESEISPDWLQGLNSVGVTAGASTPNWMIRRVVSRLESLARDGNRSWQSFFQRFLRALVLSNIYVAAGAGVLGLAVAMLSGHRPESLHFSLFFCSAQFMHTLNAFFDRAAGRFNDPERARFLEKYRLWMMLGGGLAQLLALSAAYLLGPLVLALIILMSILAPIYYLPLNLSWLGPKLGRARLKDLPASKGFSVAAGWTILLICPIYLADSAPNWTWATLITLAPAGLVVFLNVFIRCTLVDILEVQGDRIFGRETLPIMLGERRTLLLLGGVALIWALVLVGAWLLGWWPALALMMLAGPLCYLVIIAKFNESQATSTIAREALLDGPYFLLGFMAWLWSFL